MGQEIDLAPIDFGLQKSQLFGLKLRGDEAVLDMGCGRGAVLTAVARKLTTGRVIGIDIWNTMDQSGNAREVTLRNAFPRRCFGSGADRNRRYAFASISRRELRPDCVEPCHPQYPLK